MTVLMSVDFFYIICDDTIVINAFGRGKNRSKQAISRFFVMRITDSVSLIYTLYWTH